MADTPTLDEISQMPEGPEELAQHLYANGYAIPPPPPAPPAPLIPDANVAPMAPVSPYAGAYDRTFAIPKHDTDLGGGPPEMGGTMRGISAQPSMGTLGPVHAWNEKDESIQPSFDLGFAGRATPAPPRSAVPVPGAEMVPPEITAMGGAPAGAPAGGAIPTPGPPMTLTKPTKQESKEAGQEERKLNIAQYQRERPQITAPYNTQGYWDQIAAQKDYDLRHPLGAPISRMPGRKGEILHELAMAGEIAGGAVAPNIMPMIPGTRQNLALGEGTALREGSRVGKEQLAKEEATSRMGEEAARTEAIKQQTEKSENEEQLVTGPNGEINGVKIGGEIHALTDPAVPQSIRDVAAVTEGKLIKPTVEKLDNGDVIGILPGHPAMPPMPATEGHPATPGTPATPPSVQLLYHGDPKLETDLTTRTVGGQEHHILVNKKTGEDVKDLGAFKTEVSPAQLMATMKHDETEMIAYDANHNSYIAPFGQVRELGLQHPVHASPADRKNAEDATSALNEVGKKTLNMDKSLRALDQNLAQRLIIANGLSHVNRGDTATQILDSYFMKGASKPTEDFIIAAQNLREAVLALPKVVTGTSRMTDVQAQALWKTIVDGSASGSKYAHRQLYALDEMTARQWRKVPLVEGNPREYAFPEVHKGQPRSFEDAIGGKAGGGAVAPPAGGGGGATVRFGGKDYTVGADGTITIPGKGQYRVTPGSKDLTKVK
jgi:hypothetical protein